MRWLTLILFLFSCRGYAQIPGLIPDKNWELEGYIKYMLTVNLPDDYPSSIDHLLHQRFNYEYRFNQQLRFNMGMRNRLMSGDSMDLPNYAEFIEQDNGFFNLSFNWLNKERVLANTQFDRLYIDWQNPQWQARIGRSRINWAMSTLWNPNDIFNSYSIYDFDYEEHVGSDAILLKRKLGFASSVEIVYNPNQDSDLNSLAGRYLFNYASWDMQLLTGKSGLDYIIGTGLAGDIQGAGLRSEVTWFNPIQEKHGNNEALTSSLVATLESDYRFVSQQNWMLRASVLYISNPQHQESGAKFLNLPLTARTLSFTNYTYYAEISFDLNTLHRLTFSSSYYDDGSYFFGINSNYSLANNWQVNTAIQRFDGRSNSLFSESASLLLYAQLKWSF